MNKLFILFFIISTITVANSMVFKTWEINKNYIQFYENEKLNILVSTKCRSIVQIKDITDQNCIALQSLLKPLNKKVNSLNAGKNPGAIICSEYLKSQVVYGIDRFQNERTFCKFKDDSYISTETLTLYGTNQ